MSEIRDVGVFLEDIFIPAEKIKNYAHGLSGSDIISKEERTEDILYNFLILGEAAKRVHDDIWNPSIVIKYILI